MCCASSTDRNCCSIANAGRRNLFSIIGSTPPEASWISSPSASASISSTSLSTSAAPFIIISSVIVYSSVLDSAGESLSPTRSAPSFRLTSNLNPTSSYSPTTSYGSTSSFSFPSDLENASSDQPSVEKRMTRDAIAVGTSLGSIVLIIASFLIYRCRRKRKRRKHQPKQNLNGDQNLNECYQLEVIYEMSGVREHELAENRRAITQELP